MRLEDGYVAIDNFSPDHWSTLAYAETVMVECGFFQVGFDARMRQGRRHFRVMHEQCRKPKRPSSGAMGVVMDNKYSTTMRDGTVVQGHDDWHCVQDMVAAGLMTSKDDSVEPCVKLHLTDLGRDINGQLRAHKASGGSWKTFEPKLEQTV